MDAHDWDARYSQSELVWGSEPNRFVAAELSSLQPSRALDLACGEGRNAIWLATRGWHAVGVDFSAAAIERARALAVQAGVDQNTEFVVGDVVTGPLPAGSFDAVIIAYLHLPAELRSRVMRAAAERVSASGLLVVVGHDTTNLLAGVGGPQDASVLFSPSDIVNDIGAAFRIVKAERVHRSVTTSEGEGTAVDALVVANRA